MSDNLRQYRAIRNALTQGYPREPTGRVARHVATLAALISGMVASKSTQWPQVAAHVPNGPKPESRVQHCARWHQAGEPRQTLCQVGGEHHHHGGSLFCAVCAGLAMQPC